MKRTILKIDPILEIPKRKRVAAYARVSSGKESMLNSLANQVSYFKRKIESEHTWEFAGIYADEALTGTTSSRSEFQTMLHKCREGQIDMIITKSISRFARNTQTLLETIRELKELNINVFFEEENINTLSGEGEMILTFLATFAQEESRSVSENMKWRIQKDFEKGLIWGGNSCLGYKLKDKQLHLVPEEANVVKLIYSLYLEGFSDGAICRILDSKGIKPSKAKKWNRTTIIKILTNYNYTGDLILQKTYRDNHLDKNKKVNNGEVSKYIASDAHEAIISKETFYIAQDVRKSKTANIRRNKRDNNPFRGMVRCGKCNKAYTYRKSKYNEVWMCSTYRTKGKSMCDSKQVPEKKLKEAVIKIMKLTRFNKDKFHRQVDSITVLNDNRLLFKFKDGNKEKYVWEYESRSESWTDEMREKARLQKVNNEEEI